MIRPLRLLLAAAFIAAPCTALAQSTLLQGGSRTTGRVPMYVGSGTSGQVTVQDSGPAGGGGPGIGVSELNITARGTGTAPYAGQGTGPNGEVSCIFDAPTTNSTGYHSLCLSANVSNGGLISYQANGAASSLPFNFMINGTSYEFPFTTTGVIGPATSVVGHAACWNNTSGTLLADCGAFVTVGGNNTWTGTNNFTGTFQIGGITQAFPASGNLVGTSDVQTLTNKHIGASQIDSGTLPGTVMPAYTGDVTSPAGSTVNTIAANAVTNAKLATATQNTVKGAATSTAIADLTMPSCSGASNALQWTTNTGFGCGTLGATTAGWGLTLSGGGVFSISTAQPPYGFDVPINMGLTASVAGSALTINLTGANGSAASATNPVSVPFRSTTLTTGTPVWTAITSALSVVVPSAATLGTTNNVPFRIWIFLAYNSGTPELGVATCSTTTQVFPCSGWENTRVTTTTISGFATAAGTLYATSGVSNDAVRIVGYCDYAGGLATAGSWATSCTSLQIVGPGSKKPGDIVQIAAGSSSTPTTGSGVTPTVTVPAVSMTISTTPNLVRLVAAGSIVQSNSPANGAQIYRAAGAVAACTTAVGALVTTALTATNNTPLALTAFDAPASAAQQSYAVCIKSSGATNPVWCPNTTITNTCTIEAQEIMGALPEPANDNIDPGVFSATG